MKLFLIFMIILLNSIAFADIGTDVVNIGGVDYSQISNGSEVKASDFNTRFNQITNLMTTKGFQTLHSFRLFIGTESDPVNADSIDKNLILTEFYKINQIYSGGELDLLLSDEIISSELNNLFNNTLTLLYNYQPANIIFNATALSLELGQSTNLNWSVTGNSVNCISSTLSGDLLFNGSKSLSGNESISPTQDSTYRLSCSNDLGTVNSDLNIIVTIPNTAPIADNKSVIANLDTSKIITLSGSDPENDPLTYIIINSPSNGTLEGTAPNVTYTPNNGYIGSDSFTFKVSDGNLESNIATVLIEIQAPEISLPITKFHSESGRSFCAIDSNNNLFCWGNNFRKQLGVSDDDNLDRFTPEFVKSDMKDIKINREVAIGVDMNGELWGWGYKNSKMIGFGSTGVTGIPNKINMGFNSTWTVKSYDISLTHACAISDADDLYCWGRGVNGALGNGSYSDATSPSLVSSTIKFREVSVGYHFTCAIASDYTVYCWGKNDRRQLGLNDRIDSKYNTPQNATPIGPTIRLRSLQTTDNATCGISGNNVYCLGENSHYIASTSGSITYQNLMTSYNSMSWSGTNGKRLQFIRSMNKETRPLFCGLTTDNEFFCWGNGQNSTNGTVYNTYGNVFTDFRGGLNSSSEGNCGIASNTVIPLDSRFICWGRNNYGQIGDNSPTTQTYWFDDAVEPLWP